MEYRAWIEPDCDGGWSCTVWAYFNSKRQYKVASYSVDSKRAAKRLGKKRVKHLSQKGEWVT